MSEHQRLTIERYDELLPLCRRVPLIPVLQGFTAQEYIDHLRSYGDRIEYGMWVGVGSVCKRNSNVQEVRTILSGIKKERPDIRLHGLGLKITALECPEIHGLLHSADSMAWSFAARMEGRNANDWREAKNYEQRIAAIQQRHALTP